MLRKSLLVLGPMSFAVVALLACEDDSVPDAVGTIDAGNVNVIPPPPPTTGASGDSGMADDGAVVTAAVSVTVTGTLLNGVNVIFHDASGAVLDKVQTGADGKATSSAAGIAMVTALQNRDQLHRAVTWTNVARGDNLTLGEIASTASAGTYTVTVPQLLGNRSGYRAYSGSCASAPATTSEASAISLTSPRCIGASPSALLASALVVTDGKSHFSFTKTGPAAPFGGSNIPATLGAWALPSTTSVAIANNMTATAVTSNVGEIANRLLYMPVAAQTVTTEPVSFDYPTGFADALQAQVGVTVGPGINKFIVKRFDPGPSVAFDYGQLLGTMTGSTVDATNASRPILAWGGDSTANTDGGLVSLAFSLPSDRGTYVWTFVVPPGTTTVTAPALPADVPFAPAADAGASVTFMRPFVWFIEADAFDSPASFRQQQGATFGPFTVASLVQQIPVLSANGTFRSTGFVSLR